MPCTSPISQTTFGKSHSTHMTHSNPEAIAVLVIPQEDWYNKKHPLMGPHNETYVLGHLDPHTLSHSPKPYSPSTWLVLSPTSSSSFAYDSCHHLHLHIIIPILPQSCPLPQQTFFTQHPCPPHCTHQDQHMQYHPPPVPLSLPFYTQPPLKSPTNHISYIDGSFTFPPAPPPSSTKVKWAWLV